MARNNLRPVYVNSTTTAPAPTTISGTAPITQSLAASFSTVSTAIPHLDAAVYQVNVTTSDSTGTFYLQMSSDNNNFVDVGTAGTAAAANDTILCEIDINRVAPYIRLRYSSSVAGTGTCSILLAAKQVGGS